MSGIRAPAIVLAAAAALVGVVVMSQAIPPPPRAPGAPATAASESPLALPSPRARGSMSLEEALERRRSVREFTSERLAPAEVGQLLWAAQGVTGAEGGRTAPSAGALYPLELYAVTPDGLFHYVPANHTLRLTRSGDARPELRRAAFDQASVGAAPAVIVVTGVIQRTSAKYGVDRGTRYVQLEAGHATQNLLLEAVALGLGAVPIGAFDDAGVREILGLSKDESPLYLLPVGHPA